MRDSGSSPGFTRSLSHSLKLEHFVDDKDSASMFHRAYSTVRRSIRKSRRKQQPQQQQRRVSQLGRPPIRSSLLKQQQQQQQQLQQQQQEQIEFARFQHADAASSDVNTLDEIDENSGICKRSYEEADSSLTNSSIITSSSSTVAMSSSSTSSSTSTSTSSRTTVVASKNGVENSSFQWHESE